MPQFMFVSCYWEEVHQKAVNSCDAIIGNAGLLNMLPSVDAVATQHEDFQKTHVAVNSQKKPRKTEPP
jgi:hypothetical protein